MLNLSSTYAYDKLAKKTKKTYGITTDKELADLFGKDASSISYWKKNSRSDLLIAELVKFAYKKGENNSNLLNILAVNNEELLAIVQEAEKIKKKRRGGRTEGKKVGLQVATAPAKDIKTQSERALKNRAIKEIKEEIRAEMEDRLRGQVEKEIMRDLRKEFMPKVRREIHNEVRLELQEVDEINYLYYYAKRLDEDEGRVGDDSLLELLRNYIFKGAMPDGVSKLLGLERGYSRKPTPTKKKTVEELTGAILDTTPIKSVHDLAAILHEDPKALPRWIRDNSLGTFLLALIESDLMVSLDKLLRK